MAGRLKSETVVVNIEETIAENPMPENMAGE